MDLKLYGNGLITLPTLMGRNIGFSKTIVDVSTPQHYANTSEQCLCITLAVDQLSTFD